MQIFGSKFLKIKVKYANMKNYGLHMRIKIVKLILKNSLHKLRGSFLLVISQGTLQLFLKTEGR